MYVIMMLIGVQIAKLRTSGSTSALPSWGLDVSRIKTLRLLTSASRSTWLHRSWRLADERSQAVVFLDFFDLMKIKIL